MSQAQIKTPEGLRDFLVQLPVYCNNEYTEAVGYIVWRTLKIHLTDGDNLDWRSIVNIFSSKNWREGVYDETLRGKDWRTVYFTDNRDNLHQYTMCNRQCYRAESVFYCLTCTTNSLYEICEQCFDEAAHSGHKYVQKVVTRADGRICFCCNPSVFKRPEFTFMCKNKSNNARADNILENEKIDQRICDTFNEIFDYIINTIIEFNQRNRGNIFSAITPTRSPADHVDTSEDSLPSAGFPLDDGACIMLLSSYAGNKNIEQSWVLQIRNRGDKYRERELAIKVSKILKRPIEYGICIANELRKGRGPVIVVQSTDVDKIVKLIYEFRREGVSVELSTLRDVFRRRLVEELVTFVYTLCIDRNSGFKTKYNLRTSLLQMWHHRHHYEGSVFASESEPSTEINLFGGFLVPKELPNDPKSNNGWFSAWNFSNLDDENLQKIMKAYDDDLIAASLSLSLSRKYSIHGSRFQFLITKFQDNISEEAQLQLFKIFYSIFSIRDKGMMCLAAQYFDVYLTMVYNTAASDTSAVNLSLMTNISQYTFQDPLLANILIGTRFIERALKFAFTLAAFKGEDLLACLPIPFYNEIRLPKESIRNRKAVICFKDLCVLMSTNTVPERLLKCHETFKNIIEALTQFYDVGSFKRETQEHIEFENFDFTSYFFFFSSILVLTDSYVRNISLLTDVDLRRSITLDFLEVAVNGILKFLHDSKDALPPLTDQSTVISDLLVRRPITVGGNIHSREMSFADFRVGSDIQNFLHPFSYFFKFVIQWSQCGRYNAVPKELRNCINFDEFFCAKRKNLLLSDASLSTLVLLGQISVGLWVRNGSPILYQAKMYTKYSMREFTYLSDLFNLQFSMCMCDPVEFTINYIGRWGLTNWANGVPYGDYSETEIAVKMVSECILLLIQLLTEVRSLVARSSIDSFERTLQAEILHSICFQNMTYSAIVDSIPDHITNHSAFDRYLEEYTVFTPGRNSFDPGTFSLKEQYKDELNPYYFGLSNTKRYEVEKGIRMHMTSKNRMKFADTFIPAKNISNLLKETNYHNLFSITSVDIFGTFLKNTLEYVKKFGYEVLFSRVLHLVHVCVVNNTKDFMRIFWHKYEATDAELSNHNSIGSILYSFLHNNQFSEQHGKIREIFKHISIHAPFIDICGRLKHQCALFNQDLLQASQSLRLDEYGEHERKKKKANLVKKKILRKLARHQKEFLNNNANESLDNRYGESSVPLEAERMVYPLWEREHCTFCMDPKNEDVFVYFAFLEKNICDVAISFKKPFPMTTREVHRYPDVGTHHYLNEVGTNHLVVAPVLKICGHGCHIKCLGSYMRASRVSLTQAIKNIPESYGYGIFFCPVCNSLSNCYLPRAEYPVEKKSSLIDENCMVADAYAELVYKNSLLLLRDLYNTSEGDKNIDCRRIYECVNDIFINSVTNLELQGRSTDLAKDEFTPVAIPLRSRLMLRLLLFLKKVAYKWCSDEYSLHFSEGFRPITHSRNYLTHAAFTVEAIQDGKTPNNLHHLLKEAFDKILLSLIKRLVCTGFFADHRYARATPTREGTINECTSLILKKYLSLLLPQIRINDELLNYTVLLSHNLLRNALLIFLRRLHLILRVCCSVDILQPRPKVDKKDLDSLILSLNLLTIKNYDDFVKDFWETYAQDMDQYLTGGSMNALGYVETHSSLDTIDEWLPSPEKFRLIDLPMSLSDLLVTHSKSLNEFEKFSGHEIALCLLCGRAVSVQLPVPTHAYKIGECTNHSRNECVCGMTYGVFFLPQSNRVYLGYEERGAFYPSPYTSKYGESNLGLRFSTPVFLNKDLYEQLSDGLLLSGIIPDVVFRTTGGLSDLGGWETL